MNDTVTREIAKTVDSEEPREARARAAAELIRSAREYRWVGIYDVDDAEIALIGEAGASTGGPLPLGKWLHDQVLETRRAAIGKADAVAPVLGAESAIVIGTIDVQIDESAEFFVDDFNYLEECAEAIRPLYD
jgi:putative methionine-R-sulfoxide reductase with GAF domain